MAVRKRRGRPKVKVTQQELDKAYRLYKKGTLYKDLIKKIGRSQSFWQKNRNIYDKFFRRREEEEDRKISKERGRGRPKGQRKFTLAKRKKLIECLENDMNVAEASKMVGVHKDTVYAWCEEFPEFKRQMDIARSRGILDVKKALKKSSQGGYIIETTTKDILDSKGNLVSTLKTRKKKFIPANVNAQIFTLVNKIGWTKDAEQKGKDNKGEILKALEEATNISEKDMEDFE